MRTRPEWVNPFWAGNACWCLKALCCALTVEKEQIYKLISRHRVARYELCRSALFRNREKMVQNLGYRPMLFQTFLVILIGKKKCLLNPKRFMKNLDF